MLARNARMIARGGAYVVRCRNILREPPHSGGMAGNIEVVLASSKNGVFAGTIDPRYIDLEGGRKTARIKRGSC